MVWEKTDSWTHRYNLAKKYFEENGNLDISQTYVTEDNIWLGKWLAIQRMAARESDQTKKLDQEKYYLLNEIGMDWMTPQERKWEEGYSYAEEYFFIEGNLNLNKDYLTETGFPLGRWLYEQRRSDKEDSKMTKYHRKRLEEIGIY